MRSFVMRNTGETSLDFEWKTASPFSVRPLTGSLAPGATQQITAVLQPQDAATYVANVRNNPYYFILGHLQFALCAPPPPPPPPPTRAAPHRQCAPTARTAQW